MSETHIACCEVCRGEGIRVIKSLDDPAINATFTWRGACVFCDGRGTFEWTRGKSLPPIRRLVKIAIKREK